MSGARQGAQGGNTGSVEQSPARKKRQAQKRRAQDKRWAAKAGPVTVRKIGEEPTD